MLRGYWVFISALGLILASPSHGQEAKADQAETREKPASQLARIEAALKVLPVAPTPDRGCQPGQDDRQSDLCAQWKAADAAADSARWTLLTFIASLVGVLLGGGTLFAAWCAAHWAKKAAEHTETGAKATIVANELARQSAQDQLRPYLYIEKIEPRYLDPHNPQISVKLRNFGQTPALNVRMENSVRRCQTGQVIGATVDLTNANQSRDIPPNHTQTCLVPMSFEDWAGTVEQINTGQIVLVVNFRYMYSGMGVTYAPDGAVIVFDMNGPRQSLPSDNLTKG